MQGSLKLQHTTILVVDFQKYISTVFNNKISKFRLHKLVRYINPLDIIKLTLIYNNQDTPDLIDNYIQDIIPDNILNELETTGDILDLYQFISEIIDSSYNYFIYQSDYILKTLLSTDALIVVDVLYNVGSTVVLKIERYNE